MASDPPFADAASPCMMECLWNTQGTRLKNDENLARFRDFGKLSEWPRRKFASFAWRKTVLSAHRRDGHGAKCRCPQCENLFCRSSFVVFHGVSGCMIQRGFVLDLTETSARSAEPHDLQLWDANSLTAEISASGMRQFLDKCDRTSYTFLRMQQEAAYGPGTQNDAVFAPGQS